MGRPPSRRPSAPPVRPPRWSRSRRSLPPAQESEDGDTIAPEPVRPDLRCLGLAEQRHRGDRLRLGAVREQTAAYASYDVTYRSRSTTGPGRQGEESWTISGVLNVPRGRGPFPALVLAHGYIDPAKYVTVRACRASGTTWPRGVTWRCTSTTATTPAPTTTRRPGAAAGLHRRHDQRGQGAPVLHERAVDHDRVALLGRSMGGGVSARRSRPARAWSTPPCGVRLHQLPGRGQLAPVLPGERRPSGPPPTSDRPQLFTAFRPTAPTSGGRPPRRPFLRPGQRAGPGAPRHGGRHLPHLLVAGDGAGAGGGGRRRHPCARTGARGTPSARRSTPPWTGRSGSSTSQLG